MDTGGTFTDLVVAEPDGSLGLHKTATVPSDPVQGVLDALGVAAAATGQPLSVYLARGDSLVHGTTHAVNAIITGATARTGSLFREIGTPIARECRCSRGSPNRGPLP